jgi:polysaccharide pyruvyl transferase WcaK-like protein
MKISSNSRKPWCYVLFYRHSYTDQFLALYLAICLTAVLQVLCASDVFASIGGEKLLQVSTASSTPLQVVSATREMIHKIQTRVSECPEGPDAFTFSLSIH